MPSLKIPVLIQVFLLYVMKLSFKDNTISLSAARLSIRLPANLLNARSHAASEPLAGAIYSLT